MIIIFSIIFYLIELLMLFYLACKIAKHHAISLKDTLVYPFVFIVAFFVTFSGYMLASDNTLMDVVPKCISDALNIVKLSLDTTLTNTLKSLGGEYNLLLGSYLGIYVVSLASLVSLSILLCITAFKNAIRIVCRWFRKELIIVFGLNEDGKAFIKNLGEKKKNTIVILDASKAKKQNEDKFYLDSLKIAYLSRSYAGEKALKFLKTLIRSKKVSTYVVSFFEEEKQNYEIIANAKAFIENSDKVPTFIICSSKLNQSYLEELINDNLSKKAKGKIRTFNKYDLIAYDFICTHNFAKYLDQDMIADDCTVNDCDINLYMFGYGKVGQAILRDVLINSQFITKEEVNGSYILKPKRMNVSVYEKNSKNSDIDTALGFMKYNKANFNQDDYLELIDNYLDASCFKFGKSVDDFNIIEGIYDELKHKDKKQVNYFIISIDSDSANWDLASRLKHHLDALPNSKNVFFFRTKTNFKYKAEANLINFGVEDAKGKNVVLSYDNVIKEKIYAWAAICHHVYENGSSSLAGLSKEELLEKFKTINRLEELSNLYAIANMYFKLTLMKLKDLKAEYKDSYITNDSPYSYDKLSKPKNSFSKKEVLAFLEHERWNAFEVGYGVLPLKKEICIAKSKEEGTLHRKHPTNNNYLYHLAITTQAGLASYYSLAKSLGFSEDVADVVRYDYYLMDSFSKDENALDYYIDKL